MKIIASLLMGMLAACSDDASTVDTTAHDVALVDVQQADSHVVDSNPAVDARQDVVQGLDQNAVEAGTVVSCQQGGSGECTGTSLTCQCCGSIGPTPICLCSKTCSTDNDCNGTGLPLCNKPPGGSGGICTPQGYNCCWLCQ